jgi:signal transduction histidine kinase
VYIIGSLVILIGLIPAVLGIFLYSVFKETRFSVPLSIFMFLICFWQIDIGILYFHDFLPKNLILFIFKLFRAAILFVIPVIIYISYISYSRNTYVNKEKSFMDKIISFVISKPVYIFSIIWSIITYIINWTPYGVTGFYSQPLFKTSLTYYYPTYGILNTGFLVALSIFVIVVLICNYFSLKYIPNKPLKQFMKTFTIFAFLLILGGILNLWPELGSLGSSVFVIAFSLAVVLAFTRMYLAQLNDYNKLVRREKKLDYMGSLAASLIHEIRNPLHHIKNYSYVISKTQPLNEEGKELFTYLQNATKQLETIVESFTDYIQTSKFELKTEDLNEVIEQAIELTKGNLEEHRVQIKFKKEFKKLNVPINKTYITQVFVNLIKNSAESIPEDRDHRQIVIYIDLLEDYIVVNLLDTGKGIPPEDWERVFNPFISDKKRGMGIGLAFSRKIMFEHRGDLKIVDSNPEGTHLQVIIPKNTFSY